MKRVYGFVVATIVFAFLFSLNCNFGQKAEESDSPSKAQKSYGGTVVIGVWGDAETLNPIFSTDQTAESVINLIFSTLLKQRPDLSMGPNLTESWEFSPDHKVLTLYFRDNLTWPDGTPFTAEDARFSFELYGDSLVASPRGYFLDRVEKFEAADEKTFIIHFSEPYPDQLFDIGVNAIVPKHLLDNIARENFRTAEFNRSPIGSGPFKLVKWESNSELVLESNENYFGGRPYLDRVIIRIIPDETSRIVALETGEIDVAERVSYKDIDRLKQNNKDLNFTSIKGKDFEFIGWNFKNPLFKSKKVRQALTTSLDIETMINTLLYGYGQSCTGPTPPIFDWAYNDQIVPFQYDPEKAKSMLAEEGWTDSDGDGWIDKDGKIFEFTIKTNRGNQTREDAVVMVQSQLEKVGVKVTPQTLDFSVFIEHLTSSNFDAFLAGWTTQLAVDPSPIFHSKYTFALNWTNYANREVDQLLEEGRRELDKEKAGKIWREFQEVLYDDQPYTFLFWRDQVVAVHKRFQDVDINIISPYDNLEKWWVPAEERKYTPGV